MEHGKFKYYWTRWPAIIIMFIFACVGVLIIYGVTQEPKLEEVRWLLGAVGVLLIIMGIWGSITSYLNGYAYRRISKCSLDELPEFGGMFQEFDNGLLISIDNRAKFIFYGDHIVKRGYVQIRSEYDRKKKLKSWRLTAE